MNVINYDNLSQAQSRYLAQGYRYIEVPWVVSEAVNDVTRPSWVAQYFVTKKGKKKTFIGSGEQGLLYLACKGYLPNGKYQTITPCMRDDDFDAWHTKYFMKCELMVKFGESEKKDTVNEMLWDVIYDAQHVFTNMGLPNTIVLNQDDGYDITFDGIELGSYGIRHCEFANWIYGTGLAEPRFSSVLKNQK